MVILIVMAPYPLTVHGGLSSIKSSVSMMAGIAWNPLLGKCLLAPAPVTPVWHTTDRWQPRWVFIHIRKNGNGHIGRHNQVLINGTNAPVECAYKNGQRCRTDREDILDLEQARAQGEIRKQANCKRDKCKTEANDGQELEVPSITEMKLLREQLQVSEAGHE